jgi:glycosyltransferase involved in cell wall biosynthesis
MKSGRNTLVVLTPAFPENEQATYWVPSQQLMVKALKRNFPDLNIIVLSLLYPYQSAPYKWNDIDVFSFDGTHKRKLKRLLLWIRVWKALKKIRRDHNIIGLLSFWCGECALLGKYFGRRYSIKHISWICGQDARKSNNWVRVVRPKEHELAAMSPFLANEFQKNHGVRPKYMVPNAIDIASFPTPAGTERPIDILGVGSLHALKQYDVFTEVIASIRSSIPNINVIHCGQGSEVETDQIKHLIEKLDLQNNFKLAGSTTHEEILATMQQAKVFMHTSNYEGFSTACIEALYAGAEVISFCYPLDYPVPRWHVVGTPDEMKAKALEILRKDAKEYTPVMLYSIDDSARAMMELLEAKADKRAGN